MPLHFDCYFLYKDYQAYYEAQSELFLSNFVLCPFKGQTHNSSSKNLKTTVMCPDEH